MRQKLDDIARVLRSANPYPAIEALQNWSRIVSAGYFEARDLVSACPTINRDCVASAIREVLSEYPQVIFGVPVLMHYCSPWEDWFELPKPHDMPAGVSECWWMSLQHLYPQDHNSTPPGILSNRPQVGILLVRTKDNDGWNIEDKWLGELFGCIPDGASMYLSARMVLPWLDAVEAAFSLKAAAATGQQWRSSKRAFLSDHAWTWATNAGFEFRRFAALQS